MGWGCHVKIFSESLCHCIICCYLIYECLINLRPATLNSSKSNVRKQNIQLSYLQRTELSFDFGLWEKCALSDPQVNSDSIHLLELHQLYNLNIKGMLILKEKKAHQANYSRKFCMSNNLKFNNRSKFVRFSWMK